MASWKKVVTSGSSPVFNNTSICGTLALGNFTDVSASLASLGGTSITRANLTFTSSNSTTGPQQYSYQVSTDPNLNYWLVTGSRAAILNTSRTYPNIISGSYGQYATEVIVNGISNVIRQTGNEASTVENTNVTILNGSNNLISSSVDSSILGATQSTIQGVRYSIIGGGNSNCIITDCVSGGSCSSGGHAIVAGQNNRISGSSSTSNMNWKNTIGGGEQNVLYQTGCSFIGAGHTNTILGNSATFVNGNKTYKENSIVGGRCNDIIDERNSHIIGGACNKIIGDSTQNTTLQGSGNVIGAGHCNVITGSCCSAILGGKDNCLEHNDSFIIGSCITSSAACTTFVNNLCVLGNLTTDGTDTQAVYERGTGTDSVKPVDSSNSASGTFSTVLGGCNNNVETYISAIVSGRDNSIVGNNIASNNYYNTILNGRCNQISASICTTILGGQCNTASYTGGSLVSGDCNKIIDATNNPSYRSDKIIILGGSNNNVHNWYSGNNISTADRSACIGLFNTFNVDISGSRFISILGGIGHDVFTTASNGSHSSTVCNTSFIGGISNRAGSNTINSIVSNVNFIGGTTNCAYRGDGEIIGGKNNCFLNSGSAFSLAITIGGCHNTQTNSTGASERDNNIIAGGRYNSIDGASFSNILGGSSNCLKLTRNSHILGNSLSSEITGSSTTTPNISFNNTIIGGCNVNLYNTSGIIAIGVYNRTISNCQISSNKNKVFMDTLEVTNLCTTSEIESPIGKFAKLRGASPITSEDTINITASFDSGAFTHPALILSGSEAIQATGSVDISGSLSITGFANVSSSLAAASSIPTLQEVTTQGNITNQGLIVTGSTTFKPISSGDGGAIELTNIGYSGLDNPIMTFKDGQGNSNVVIGHRANDGQIQIYDQPDSLRTVLSANFSAFNPGSTTGNGIYFGLTSSMAPTSTNGRAYIKMYEANYSGAPAYNFQLNNRNYAAGSGTIGLYGIMSTTSTAAPAIQITSINSDKVVNFGGPSFIHSSGKQNNYLKYGLQIGGGFTGTNANMPLTDGSLIMSGSGGLFSIKSVSSEAEIKTNNGATTLTLGTTSSFTAVSASSYISASKFIGDGSQLTGISAGTDFTQSLFVSPSGDNSTAIVGDMSKPFATILGATGSANPGDTIIVYPGKYIENNNLYKDGVNYHFINGAIVESTNPVEPMWGGGGGAANSIEYFSSPVSITGHGEFINTSNTVRTGTIFYLGAPSGIIEFKKAFRAGLSGTSYVTVANFAQQQTADAHGVLTIKGEVENSGSGGSLGQVVGFYSGNINAELVVRQHNGAGTAVKILQAGSDINANMDVYSEGMAVDVYARTSGLTVLKGRYETLTSNQGTYYCIDAGYNSRGSTLIDAEVRGAIKIEHGSQYEGSTTIMGYQEVSNSPGGAACVIIDGQNQLSQRIYSGQPAFKVTGGQTTFDGSVRHTGYNSKVFDISAGTFNWKGTCTGNTALPTTRTDPNVVSGGELIIESQFECFSQTANVNNEYMFNLSGGTLDIRNKLRNNINSLNNGIVNMTGGYLRMNGAELVHATQTGSFAFAIDLNNTAHSGSILNNCFTNLTPFGNTGSFTNEILGGGTLFYSDKLY